MWVKKLPGPGEFPLLVTRIIWQGAGLGHAVIFGEKNLNILKIRFEDFLRVRPVLGSSHGPV